MTTSDEECTLLWAGDCTCRYCVDFPKAAASWITPISTLTPAARRAPHRRRAANRRAA